MGVFITASFPFVVVEGAPVDRTFTSSLNIQCVLFMFIEFGWAY